MAPRYKIDAVKRVTRETMASDSFNRSERFAYLLGMRSMSRILAGETAGVTLFMQKQINEEVHL